VRSVGFGVFTALLLALPACGQPGAEELVVSMLPALERLSGLEAIAPVRVEPRSREELRDYVVQRMDERWRPGQVEAITRVYELVGLLPPGIDLRTLLLDLYTEQVLGYYDPPTATLYVMDGVPAAELRTVVAHELVHALQGQHVDLDSLLDPDRGNDRQLAAAAAIEGHAVLVTLALTAEELGAGPMSVDALPNLRVEMRPAAEAERSAFPVFSAAPRYVREVLMFPYAEGAGYVQELWKAFPDRPPPFGELLPQSSQQVLHTTERFLDDRAEPVVLDFSCDAAAWTGAEAAYENEFGQFEVMLILEEALGGAYRGLAHEWAGDRYRLLDTGSESGSLEWYVAWRSHAAADAFADAFNRIIEESGWEGTVDRLDVDDRPLVRVVLGDTAALPVARDPGLCVITE